jgi:hypothetical protein
MTFFRFAISPSQISLAHMVSIFFCRDSSLMWLLFMRYMDDRLSTGAPFSSAITGAKSENMKPGKMQDRIDRFGVLLKSDE